MLYKTKQFKLLGTTWNEKLKLPDGSFTISNIQYYFKYIIRNMKYLLVILKYKFMLTN